MEECISKTYNYKFTIQVIKNIHSGITNLKPVLDNQFIVRNTTKGRGDWVPRGNSKPQEAHVVQRKRFPTRFQHSCQFYRA